MKRETIINQTVLRNWRPSCKQQTRQYSFDTLGVRHPEDMEKRDNPRARGILISFVILIALIFVILVTVIIFNLYRLTLSQSERIQTFEAVVGELTARVHKLEARFTAQKTDDEKSVGETDREPKEKSEKDKRLRNKVSLKLAKQFVACCPNLCIYDNVNEHKLFNSFVLRWFWFLQQMGSHSPQTRGKRQFYGYDVENEGRCYSYLQYDAFRLFHCF